MAIRFVALNPEQVAGYRAGRPDANGQTPEIHMAPADGLPCRHCLGLIRQGERFLILAHRPFPKAQPYAEVGPIFLHAESCSRNEEPGSIPAFLASPRYILRGYGHDDRIVYGSGRITPTGEISETADDMLQDPRLAYVHVRSATNNCFHCRIERA
jgi:hypothetical protein